MNCIHALTTTGPVVPYTGSVAKHPYTEENRAAHGNVSYTESCTACGAQRRVNMNGRHVEVGPWVPGAATRVAQAQAAAEQLADEARRQREAVIADGQRRLAAQGARVIARYADGQVEVFNGVGTVYVSLADIRAGAQQPDDGDGLVPIYCALDDAASRLPVRTAFE